MSRSALTSYHFDLGDSSQGPLGLCARVSAPTPEEALTLLRRALPEAITVPVPDHPSCAGIEYVNVYLNPDAITTADIDSEEPVEADAPQESW